MKSREILHSYLKFYGDKGHEQVPNVSLVPENDPTLLYVNSGMFPLVPYLSGESHPLGKRLMNVQRCLRFFEDLENVGVTNRHTTAFHMIGNWSLGDYFKKEQLPWVYSFFIDELGLDPNKMYATVFAGDDDAPRDEESIEVIKDIFKKYGIDAKENERIFALGKEDNWWKRGEAVGELGGPDSEIFYYIGKEGTGFGLNPSEHQSEFIEIGNSVFMQYKKAQVGWEELSQKNVDFGGGIERIALAVQGKQDIFETDNFWPVIEKLQDLSGLKYNPTLDIDKKKAMCVLADHMRASVLLAMDGVEPSNKDQGYILRRLLRRMVRAGRKLGLEKDISVNLVGAVLDIEILSSLYPELEEKQKKIEKMFAVEEEKFSRTLSKGSVQAKRMLAEFSGDEDSIAKLAFDLYQSIGYPFEIFAEDVKDVGFSLDFAQAEELFDDRVKSHQEKSRKGAEQKFAGGLADHSEQVIKYHTATHLLHLGLRKVLGDQVTQRGSNITNERLRFDFNYDKKLTDEEMKDVENVVNDAIKASLPVSFEIMDKVEAEKTGAIHAFGEKYGDKVKVYFVGDTLETAISKEFCGGPHVKNTSEIGHITLYKQQAIGRGLMRIYAK